MNLYRIHSTTLLFFTNKQKLCEQNSACEDVTQFITTYMWHDVCEWYNQENLKLMKDWNPFISPSQVRKWSYTWLFSYFCLCARLCMLL